MAEPRMVHGHPGIIGQRGRGQALVLFALFLLVLLGASALAIDYANWLLTDRRLQNVADHAALAGASAFQQRISGNCGADPGLTQCNNARAQAWASLNQDLSQGNGTPAPLGLDDATVACLASKGDTPAAGWTESGSGPQGAGCTNTPSVSFGHTIWVTTPPPNNVSYTSVGGQYYLNYAVVFVRVDEPTRSFLGSALGIVARDRIGWATAGPLPSDFALQVFCRNNIAPQNGACGGSGATSLVIDGQGGINLVRGDIGSNESLKVTATNGGGVVTQAGNVFLVNGVCSSSLWRCPNGPPSLGGISDGAPNYDGKNAFYMPPQPVPHYATPLADVTVSAPDCATANISNFCVPYRPWMSGSMNAPGDWSCDPSGTFGSNNLCGIPTVLSGTVRCDANIPVGVTPSTHLLPSKDISDNQINGNPNPGAKKLYQNIYDNPEATPPAGDSFNPPPSTPVDYVYTADLQTGTSKSKSFEVALRPPFGRPQGGFSYIRFVAFKTLSGGVTTSGGNPVDVTVELKVNGQPLYGPITETDISTTPTRFDETVDSLLKVGLPTTTNFNALSLQFTFTSPTGSGGTSQRGGAVAWAELQTPTLDPALPPMIPPGYYHSIVIPDGGCAVMDPTSQYYGYTYPALEPYQKPGIYRFGGGNNDATISVGAGSFLIGDGVTLVFDPGFPNPTGGKGIVVGANGALVLNTMLASGQPPCTGDADTGPYNPSSPLSLLPYSSVCAAWTVDSSLQSGLHAGQMAWPIPENELINTPGGCGDPTLAQSVDRSCYEQTPTPSTYRGVTFFFTTNSWPATTIRQRFQMSGSSGSMPGIAFRGVLYAPYDDVQISGGNGFDTVGQVLAWTAKFNGGSAYINLDYPYQGQPSPPYLLEPRVGG